MKIPYLRDLITRRPVLFRLTKLAAASKLLPSFGFTNLANAANDLAKPEALEIKKWPLGKLLMKLMDKGGSYFEWTFSAMGDDSSSNLEIEIEKNDKGVYKPLAYKAKIPEAEIKKAWLLINELKSRKGQLFRMLRNADALENNYTIDSDDEYDVVTFIKALARNKGVRPSVPEMVDEFFKVDGEAFFQKFPKALSDYDEFKLRFVEGFQEHLDFMLGFDQKHFMRDEYQKRLQDQFEFGSGNDKLRKTNLSDYEAERQKVLSLLMKQIQGPSDTLMGVLHSGFS